MSEKAEKKTPADVESLLRQRDELDRAIREKYQRRVAVIFTDIQGSTQYFERFGDLAGRAMVQRHNDLLFPVIAKTGGRVVKTIGDAIMAFFENSPSAVDAAIKMQKALDEKNEQWPERERINVRIGVHVGEALVDSADVYGDTVNTAARIEAQANGCEILISDAVLAELGPSAPQVRARGAVKLKGKAHEVPLFEVRWRDREPAFAGVVSGGKSAKKFVLAGVTALVVAGLAGGLFVVRHGHFGKKLIPTSSPAKLSVSTPDTPPVQHKSAPPPVVTPPTAKAVSPEVQDVGTIALNVDTQKVIKVEGVTRVAIGDPGVIDVRQIASDQLLVIGRAPGKSLLGVTTASGRLTYMIVVHPGEKHASPVRPASHVEAKERGETGVLHLHVFPWGDLTVDGKLVRAGARDAELKLPAGAHDVRIHNPGFPDKVKRFEVVAGKTIDEDVSLAPGG